MKETRLASSPERERERKMEEQYIGEEDPTMKMEEDGEACVEEAQIQAVSDGGSGESEGSKIDASKNEEDEG